MADENASDAVKPEEIPAAPAQTEPTTPEAEKPEGAPAEGDKPEAELTDEEKVKAAAKTLADRKAAKAAENQKRWADHSRARHEAEQRAARAEARVKELETAGRLAPPDPTKFEDYGALNAAQVTHALDAREIETLRREAKDATADVEAKVAEEWQERVANFKETATDFDQVALTAPISDAAARDIARMEEGPQVAYYLGKHPAEARALNNLSERDRAVQLGRLAGRLTQAPPRRTSTAPTPVDAVAGKGAQTSRFNPETASMEEFAAKRAAGWKG